MSSIFEYFWLPQCNMSAVNAAQPKTVASLRANLILPVGAAPANSVPIVAPPAIAAAEVQSSAAKLAESLQRDVERLQQARDSQQLLLERTRDQAATREQQMESDMQVERAKCAELSKTVAMLQEQLRQTASQPRQSLPSHAEPSPRPPAPGLAPDVTLEKRPLPPTDAIAPETLRQHQSPARSTQPSGSKQRNGRSDQVVAAQLSPKARGGVAASTTALVRPSLISMTASAAGLDATSLSPSLSATHLALQMHSTPAMSTMPVVGTADDDNAKTAATTARKSETMHQAASVPAQPKRAPDSNPKVAVPSKDSISVSARATSFELVPPSSVASQLNEAFAAKFGYKSPPPAQSASDRGAQDHARSALSGAPVAEHRGDALESRTPPASQPSSAVIERSSSSMSSLPSTPQRLGTPRLASREGRLRSAEPIRGGGGASSNSG